MFRARSWCLGVRSSSAHWVSLLVVLAACGGYDAGLLGSQAKHGRKDAGAGATTIVGTDGAIGSIDGGDASAMGMPSPGTGGRGSGGGAGTGAAGAGGGTGACVANSDPT